MPVDPQVQQYLHQMAAMPAPPPSSLTPQQHREGMRSRRVMQVADRTVPGPGGPVPVRAYIPAGPKPMPGLVFFHGGGFVVGDLDTVDLRCRMLAEWVGCVVVSVDYRMGPEHPFPAAPEDCYAATVWTAEHSAELSVDPARIAVGGDSAGGNLAAVVAIMARDEGAPAIAYQYLAYPVTNADFDTPSYRANAAGFGLSREQMQWYWDQYVPDPAQRANPLASPLLAESLGGLPPALVVTAEYDPLRDEGEAYAQRLKDAGVTVEARCYEGLIHGFLGQTAEFLAARAAFGDSVASLKRALHGG